MNEQKNLLLAIVASLIILLIFQYLFPTEKTEVKKKLDSFEEVEKIKPESKILSRKTVIQNEERIYFSEKSRVIGSIALKGARFDDLILKDYKESIAPDSKQVTLLSPQNTKIPYFIELGWMSQQNINLPNKESIWEIIEGKKLGPNTPITIQWKSSEGLIFKRKIFIDENFLISVEQEIINKTNKDFNLTQYGRINRTGTPKTSGFYILHEGPIAVLNNRLIEVDYDDLLEDGSVSAISRGGWIGITDKYWLAAL
ncbi:MAG: membrane protein insertase YidC, partial [Rickettsiales bacterium]